ncbi:sugar-transfer associated ATP-grasp domain-containing protein [Paraburkholderia sp. BCC1886]|uniref:sugar-transfer associated ATP-grasp domain-containing protein n=1 Tax=Paraburkholderia sp. BCC1886 TaxID=2562670 RepID=UPI001182BB78
MKKVAQYRFHLDHAMQANRILRYLEKNQGKPAPRNMKLAESYARDVLGDAVYAPWLRVYTAFTGTFKEGWIPDNYYGSVVVPSMKGDYGKLSELKSIARIMFEGDGFPDVAYFANGLFFTDRNEFIPESEVRRTIFRATDKVVFKLDGSKQGKGVFIYDWRSFDVGAIKSLGNGVIQKFVRQHPVFDAFASTSVATLRLTTAVDDAGKISLRAAFLRLGRANETHVRSDSEVCVPVDPASGMLGRDGYLHNWSAVQAHPDSGVRFAGVQVPAFEQCVETVLAFHRNIPFVRCVGWDLSVDANGQVQILEWNGEHNDVKFSEATQGPCFSDLRWERLKPAI